MMKGVSYKKMKSYQFFQEGHIKSYEIAHGYGNVWVKSKVMASMKHELYRVIIVCKDNGDISYCACECPAGYVSLTNYDTTFLPCTQVIVIL
jgi:uncharacterized FAD-dependent dehydrogenase